MLRCLLMFVVSLSALAQDPTQTVSGRLAYYGEDFSTQETSGLKEKLYTILNSDHQFKAGQFDKIGSCRSTSYCYQHSAVGYSRARVIMFGDLFMERDSGGMFVQEVYCNKKVYYKSADQVSSMGNIVNIEHTWPQSKFTPSYNKEMQKSDLHHLYPSDSKANGVRGNFPFGMPANIKAMEMVDLCGPSDISNENGGMVFTPPAQHRGNVARSLFYFSVRYQMPIDADQEATLREWHKDDPADKEEMERNDKISKYQFTRNPFIDFPELADSIKDF
ncbi:MAG: endonuclease [Bacteriovoracaceae bacterium]|nr:endonuclease [Bacteriovoracaceae bacterium]